MISLDKGASIKLIANGVRVEDVCLHRCMLGNTRYLRIFRFGNPKAKVSAYLQAGLHGGEHPGMLVLHQLAHLLKTAVLNGQLAGQVLLVPVANPIGIAQQVQGELLGRFNMSSGQNFNRGFPQFYELLALEVENNLSEDGEYNSQIVRESVQRYLEALAPKDELDSLQNHLLKLAMQSHYVIDLHCDSESLLHVYGGESGKDVVETLSRQIGAKAFLVGTDKMGQCFDDTINGLWDYLNTRFPNHLFSQRSNATTIELRGRADVDMNYAQTDADNIYRVLQRWGLINGDPGLLPAANCKSTPLDALFSARAQSSGIVVYKKELGDVCRMGEVVAEIVNPNDPFNVPLEYLTTPVNGVLFSRHNIKLAFPNMVVFKIAGNNIEDNRKSSRLLEE